MNTGRSIDEDLQEIRDDVESIRGNTNGAFAKISSLVERVEQLEKDLEEIRATAELAKATASSGVSSDGGQSKKDVALQLSRDELVRQVLTGESGKMTDIKDGSKTRIGASLDVGDVRRMARPETELKWKTIARDAWPDLVERWPAFRIEDDPKRLVVKPEDVTSELARLVEDSLERDDLANRVVGADEGNGGGSR